MIKKILGGIVLASLLAGSVCGVVYGVKYNNLSKSEKVVSYDKQTKEIRDLQTQLAKAKGDCDTLQVSLDKMTAENTANYALVEELREEKASLEVEKSNLMAQTNADAATIADLEAQIEEKDSKIAELEATIAVNEETIATLTTDKNNLSARITQLETDLASITEENDDNLVQIALLEQQLLEAQNEVTRLSGLITDYENIKNEASQVIFYVGDKNVQTDAIKPNYCVTNLPTNETDTYRIDGWQLEDGTTVDPLTYPITEDTNFYAVYVNKYAVTFMDGETVVSSANVAADSFTWEIAPAKDGWTFEGWYLGNTKYTTEDTYALTGDVTFTAQYYKWEMIMEKYVSSRDYEAISNLFGSSLSASDITNGNGTLYNIYHMDTAFVAEENATYRVSGTITCLISSSICRHNYEFVGTVNELNHTWIVEDFISFNGTDAEFTMTYREDYFPYDGILPFHIVENTDNLMDAYLQNIERYVTLY